MSSMNFGLLRAHIFHGEGHAVHLDVFWCQGFSWRLKTWQKTCRITGSEAVNHLPTFPLSPCISLFHPCPFPTPPHPKKKKLKIPPPPTTPSPNSWFVFFSDQKSVRGPISYRLPDEALQAAKLHGCEAPANNATKSEAEAETTILLRPRTPKVRQKNMPRLGKTLKGAPGEKNGNRKKGPKMKPEISREISQTKGQSLPPPRFLVVVLEFEHAHVRGQASRPGTGKSTFPNKMWPFDVEQGGLGFIISTRKCEENVKEMWRIFFAGSMTHCFSMVPCSAEPSHALETRSRSKSLETMETEMGHTHTHT